MPSPRETYLFDLQGFLRIPDVLSSEQVAELNHLIDQNADLSLDPQTKIGWLHPIFEWGRPFRDLLDHPKIMEYVTQWIDPAARADICYGNLMGKGCAGDLHLGGTPYLPIASYHFRDGRPFSAMTVVAWALTDAPDGGGGFGCIPGSHKANVPCPENILTSYVPDTVLIQVPVRAGDVIIFTEALTHGTIPWRNDFIRRVLFFRYTPGFARFERWSYKPKMEDFTPSQRLLLEPPYSRKSGSEGRPLIPSRT